MKYKLTNNKKEHLGRTLYQIQALKDIPASNVKTGDLGGYIEKDSNLGQYGDAWVSDNAMVSDNALVYDNAMVYDNARVYGNAMVYDNARVFGNAQVYGDARVYGNARIKSKLDLVYILAPRFDLTLTNAGLSIGCERHSVEHWINNYTEIGKKHGFTDKEINYYLKLIKTAVKMLKAQQELKEI